MRVVADVFGRARSRQSPGRAGGADLRQPAVVPGLDVALLVELLAEVAARVVAMAGHSRLEQIRASMRGEQLPAGSTNTATPAPAPAANPSPTPENPLSQ